jgi:hypothetical protein
MPLSKKIAIIPIVLTLIFVLVGCSPPSNVGTSSDNSNKPSSSTHSSNSGSPNRLSLVKNEVIETQYMNIEVNEYQFLDDVAGNGGAIIAYGNGLIVGTADGSFIFVDRKSLDIKEEFLPQIDLGISEMRLSKSITYQETSPRLHDILIYKDQFYATYDKYNLSEDRVRFFVSRVELGGKWEDIYISPPIPTEMFTLGCGGAMAMNEQANQLFFSIGDFSLDRANGLPSDYAAQSDEHPWGHILRLNLNDLKTDLFSKGHRNPLGLAFLDTGELLSSEMGPKGGDEINIISEGKNYGWPFASFGTYYESFDRYLSPNGTNAFETFEDPRYSFIPSIAPTSLFQSKTFSESWQGNLVMGSLKAESLFSIFYKSGRVIFVEQIPLGRRIRDLIELGEHIIGYTDDAKIIEVSVVK